MVQTDCLWRCGMALALVLTLTSTSRADDDAQEADDPADIEAMFAEPVDFSTPMSPLASVVDASRFMHGLPSSAWGSKAGIDDREATPYGDLSPLPNAMPHQTVGVAWATITAPGLMAWDRTAFETRVDPYQESRLGVTISRSVPFGSDVSMTLQNTLAWSQSLLQEAPIVAHGSNAQTVEENHALSFTFRPVNTTFSIGATHSNADDGWRRSLSAEQRLFGGPVSITGAVSETGGGEFDGSLKAGFKRNW